MARRILYAMRRGKGGKGRPARKVSAEVARASEPSVGGNDPADARMSGGDYKFELGFWHPFGPHGGETPQSIVARNCRQIAANGWTLWSFQYRTRKTFDDWSRELARVSAKVPVFCSNGKGQGTNGISEVTWFMYNA